MDETQKVRVACSDGHKLLVNADLAGKRIRCPHKGCGKAVDVPALEDADVVDQTDPSPAESADDSDQAEAELKKRDRGDGTDPPRKRKKKKRATAGKGVSFPSWGVFRHGVTVMMVATALWVLAIFAFEFVGVVGLFKSHRAIHFDEASGLRTGGMWLGIASLSATAVACGMCSFAPISGRQRIPLLLSALLLILASFVPILVQPTLSDEVRAPGVPREVRLANAPENVEYIEADPNLRGESARAGRNAIVAAVILGVSSWVCFLFFLRSVVAVADEGWTADHDVKSLVLWSIFLAAAMLIVLMLLLYVPWAQAKITITSSAHYDKWGRLIDAEVKIENPWGWADPSFPLWRMAKYSCAVTLLLCIIVQGILIFRYFVFLRNCSDLGN